MKLNVGFIPYLNMVPFHQGFGPAPIQKNGLEIEFVRHSPRALGLEAEAGRLDAGAMSLVDAFRLSDRFEYLGDFGVGVKKAAGSVLLFSKMPISELQGICAVTDETSTSVRLLQILLGKRYARTAVSYGRVASSLLFDGDADSLLLIGDEALRAKREGIKGFPIVTDLATEWLDWQGTPFVFARWVVRKDLNDVAKKTIAAFLDYSLDQTQSNLGALAKQEAPSRQLSPAQVEAYWDGFLFKLQPQHQKSIQTFKDLLFLSSPAASGRGSIDSPPVTAGNDAKNIHV